MLSWPWGINCREDSTSFRIIKSAFKLPTLPIRARVGLGEDTIEQRIAGEQFAKGVRYGVLGLGLAVGSYVFLALFLEFGEGFDIRLKFFPLFDRKRNGSVRSPASSRIALEGCRIAGIGPVSRFRRLRFRTRIFLFFRSAFPFLFSGSGGFRFALRGGIGIFRLLPVFLFAVFRTSLIGFVGLSAVSAAVLVLILFFRIFFILLHLRVEKLFHDVEIRARIVVAVNSVRTRISD